MARDYDAVVVGAGPNGLTAGAILARAGHSVLVVEADATPGGGARTEELTLPGFWHDTCSAVHPLAVSSPAFDELDLEAHGLEWVHPDVPLAHPRDDGPAALLHRDLAETAAGLGVDGSAWRELFEPHVAAWEVLRHQLLGPVRIPRHPGPVARFGLQAFRSARGLVASRFHTDAARALLAASSAHAFVPINRPPSAGFGLLLTLTAHAVGWPVPRGGSRAITQALLDVFRDAGGKLETGRLIRSLRELPSCRLVLLDTSVGDALRIAGDRMARRVRMQLGGFRPGPGVFKIDYALDGPVPWADPQVARAGTVHVVGSLEEVAAAEQDVVHGIHPLRPLILTAQPTLFDSTRAPPGRHVFWAYCHVPYGSDVDMTEPVERQIERFAPGFRERVLARATMTAAQLGRHNRNFRGGDISAGAMDGLQLLARPRIALNPYALSVGDPLVYLCSASSPPGGAVHGMCGYHAARLAMRALDRRRG